MGFSRDLIRFRFNGGETNSYMGLCSPIMRHVFVSFGDICSLWRSMHRSINSLVVKKWWKKIFTLCFYKVRLSGVSEVYLAVCSQSKCLQTAALIEFLSLIWIVFSASPLSLITYWCFQYFLVTKQLLHLFDLLLLICSISWDQTMKFTVMIQIKSKTGGLSYQVWT